MKVIVKEIVQLISHSKCVLITIMQNDDDTVENNNNNNGNNNNNQRIKWVILKAEKSTHNGSNFKYY